MNQNKVFFLSSAQAALKNLTNGQATWFMQNPIEFASAQLGLIEFSFTNFFINISTLLGNNKVYYSNDALDLVKYTINVPSGSYSLSALNDYLSQQQQAQVGVAQTIFTLQGNYSTNKVGILFGNVTGWFVHFGADSPYTLTGFANGQNVPATKSNTAYYIEYGATAAAFNNVTSLQVSCDLTTDSISNGKGSSVIYQTSPIVEPGSTQSDRPSTVVFSALTNTRFSNISIQILDQNSAPLTLSEDFSVTIIVRY